MHILFIGYGKTSWRVAKQLFEQGHQITTISQSAKMDEYATHLVQDVHQLNLAHISPIDWVYVLLSPNESTPEAYQRVYVDSVQPISKALKQHPVQKVVVVSSTRVYGENHGERIDDEAEMKPNDEQGRLLLRWSSFGSRLIHLQISLFVRPAFMAHRWLECSSWLKKLKLTRTVTGQIEFILMIWQVFWRIYFTWNMLKNRILLAIISPVFYMKRFNGFNDN